MSKEDDTSFQTPLQLPLKAGAFLAFGVVALIGPNGLYLYALVTQPEMNSAALRNPVALAFMIEAMMLLGLFLWFVYARTRSVGKVMLYLGLSFLGSLAFSFPLFIYTQLRHGTNKNGE